MCIPSAELKTHALRHENVSILLTPYRAIWDKYGLEEDFETSFSWSIPASLLSVSLKTSCDNNTQNQLDKREIKTDKKLYLLVKSEQWEGIWGATCFLVFCVFL